MKTRCGICAVGGWLGVVLGIASCGGSGSSGVTGSTSLTLDSVAVARQVRTGDGELLLPPDSLVLEDSESGELLEILDPGTTLEVLGTGEPGFSRAPRNAVLVLRFTAALDSASIDGQSVRLRDRRTGAAITVRYRVDGTQLILDPVIDFEEASEHGLPVRLEGLPASGSASFANLELVLPTEGNARVRDSRGRPIRPRREDDERGLSDIVLQLRSGGDFDPYRGYLPDTRSPVLVTSGGQEYRSDRDRGRIDLAEVLVTDASFADDLTRVPVERLGRWTDSRVIDFDGGSPSFLAHAPLVAGRSWIGVEEVPESFVADEPLDLDGDGRFDIGVLSNGFEVVGESTGKVTEGGREQDFDAGGPYRLTQAPIRPGSLRLSADDGNVVQDDALGGLGDGGRIDYQTGQISGRVVFPIDVSPGVLVLASYESIQRGWVQYRSGRLRGKVELGSEVESGLEVVATYAYRDRTLDRVEEVAAQARVGVRFNEPIDPTSLGAFSTFFVLETDESAHQFPEDVVFGQIELDADLHTVLFRPPRAPHGWGPKARSYVLILLADNPFTLEVEGIRDLAGNGLEGGVLEPNLFQDRGPHHVFRLDFTVQESTGDFTRAVVETFDSRSVWDDDSRNEHDRKAPAGLLAGGPVRRWSWSLKDPNQGALLPNFPPGVTTPLNPAGARLQTVVPAAFLGVSQVEGPWQLEGLEWAPINGILFPTRFQSFEMRVSHTRVNPQPNAPGSGLSSVFANNPSDSPITVIPETSYLLQVTDSPPSPFFYRYPAFERPFQYNARDNLLIDIGVQVDPLAGLFNGYEINLLPTLAPFRRVYTVGSATNPVHDPFTLTVATGIPGGAPQVPGDSALYLHRFRFARKHSTATSPYYVAEAGSPGTKIDWDEIALEPPLMRQPSGAQVRVEFYGDADGAGRDATGWVEDLDTLDGLSWIRVRLNFQADSFDDRVAIFDTIALSYHVR